MFIRSLFCLFALVVFRSFVRSFFRAFVHSFVCSFVRSFVYSFVRWFVRLFIRLLICSFVRSLVCSFVRAFVRSFVNLFGCSFVPSFFSSFVYFFVYSIICRLTCPPKLLSSLNQFHPKIIFQHEHRELLNFPNLPLPHFFQMKKQKQLNAYHLKFSADSTLVSLQHHQELR